jgi:hypothetical protein
MVEKSMDTNTDYSDVFQRACLIQLSSSVWMGSKMLNPEIMQQIGESDWLKGRKYVVSPEHLGPIKTTVHQARNEVNRHALPFPITSLSLIPKESLTPVDNALKKREEQFWQKVNNFVDQYDLAREEAQKVLGDLFNPADYPEDISKKFNFEWRFLTLDLPRKSKILTPEIYQREKEKFQSMMEETRQMATEALAGELGDIVQDLINRLNGNGNGKGKLINSSMLNKMRDFIGAFDTRNVFDDQKLTEVVQQANTVIQGISPYGIKYNATMKQRIATAMGDIKDTVSKIVEDLPRRRIRLEA